MKEFNIISYDGLNLKGYLFDNVTKPIGVIQIIHGMQEHAKRYFDTIEKLNKHGYIVYISDLRGHGETATSIYDLGKSDNDIFFDCVQDQILISQALKIKYPSLDLYIIGHSFGSFIAQSYIETCDLSKKVVLIGTTDGHNAQMIFGRIVAYFTTLKNGKHGKATLIEKMGIGAYGKNFTDGNWLSRDDKVWQKYQSDKYCGTPFPVSFYKSLFKHMPKLNKSIKNIPLDTQILLLAGDKDPVGNNGKMVRRLGKKYTNACLRATVKLYPDARHELLNETNKDEVLSDILQFLKQN